MAVALVFKTNLQHHHLPKVPLQAESDFVFEAYIDPVRLPPSSLQVPTLPSSHRGQSCADHLTLGGY